ncbi:DUF3825 domain-containing protein [bacterium]|nr:DUF3825 domain-containing protein [bacterium]
MTEKTGLKRLGFVKNLKCNEKGYNCISKLSKLIGREIQLDEIDRFVDSSDFKQEFIDQNGNTTNEATAIGFRFKLPWHTTEEEEIYGHFRKENSAFTGVTWGKKNPTTAIDIRKYGFINSKCWSKLCSMSGKEISEKNIGDFLTSKIEYYNGAGHTKFPSGEPVSKETGKFIKFTTNLSCEGGFIVGWFTKNIRGKYEGISWGLDVDFKAAQKLREQFYVGQMIFDSIDECNDFFVKLEKNIIPEPWEYKKRKEEKYKYPILKAYLQFELDRLFHEQEELRRDYKIVFSENKDKILFNTNLLDKFGHDLIIVGDHIEISNRAYITNLEISPSKKRLRILGFDSSKDPMPPSFFEDINEIIFHGNWEIDQDMKAYEHIIEQRLERFPEKYQKLPADILASKLDNAIDLAKRIAQRNYKFIVPMYYPEIKKIQLLMPIYLEGLYSSIPDFALVLKPDPSENLYTPKTILGLDEVYQDARLIAKPEESWLKAMIKSDD